MADHITDDEIKQVCPKSGCGSIKFRAALNRSVGRADYPIAMISCTECNAVVGVLPVSEVWEGADKNN